MISYAEEPIYGPMVVKCTHEIEQEIAPTSKMSADMIVELSAMPCRQLAQTVQNRR